MDICGNCGQSGAYLCALPNQTLTICGTCGNIYIQEKGLFVRMQEFPPKYNHPNYIVARAMFELFELEETLNGFNVV